jgi:hypothetical protein
MRRWRGPGPEESRGFCDRESHSRSPELGFGQRAPAADHRDYFNRRRGGQRGAAAAIRGAGNFRSPGQVPAAFRQRPDQACRRLAERGERAQTDKNIQLTPTEYDRWFCSPYISSIGFQIRTVLPGTDVHAIRRVAETEGRILTRVGTLLWIVTLAALGAAALAVAATSATTVLERRAEIGVMKALGASNALVGGIFLAEQVLLAIAGGAVGFFVGVGMARFLGESVFGTPASPQLILFPVVLALAALIAMIGSLVPLRRAAHFRPAVILRGE